MTRSVVPSSQAAPRPREHRPNQKTDRQTMLGRGSTPMESAGPLQNRSESGAGHQAVAVVLEFVSRRTAEMTLSNSDP